MPVAERLRVIRKLEEKRGSRIICYLTSTRPGTSFQMGMDVVPRFYEHLRHIDRSYSERGTLELIVHSNGGDGIVPWRLVTLARESNARFNVLVPHRAFSAATLVALGADEIFMHPMGMLGPTDPTVANNFNPTDPNNPQNRLGIGVEDLYAFISLIKEDVGIRGESELVQAINVLTQQVR